MITYAGVIEGFYGIPLWDRESRLSYPAWLREHGFSFYIYAPKNDVFLRKQWDDDWPESERRLLGEFREECRINHIDFGIGFSPVIRDGSEARKALAVRKAGEIGSFLRPDIFAFLADDIRFENRDSLAADQLGLIKSMRDEVHSERFIFCPTYYSFDPILGKLFGAVPEDYFSVLSEAPECIDMFWTGARVCSDNYSLDDVDSASKALGRKPFIWDNYPVNDGKSRADRLLLRPYECRDRRINGRISGYAVNPMREAHLSKLVLCTLPFALAEEMLSADEWKRLIAEEAGSGNADFIARNIGLLQGAGLGRLSDGDRDRLKAELARISPDKFSAEISAFLDGAYRFNSECLT